MRDKLRRFRRWSLTTQLIASYFVIVAVVGLTTSAVGTWMTSRAFMQTAQNAGLHEVAVATRNQIILVFFLIATCGFALIIGTTYLMIRRITHPLVEMADAAHAIAQGEFDGSVATEQPGELGILADAFNRMLASLRQMRADLEDWGRTLEHKVKSRTDELVTMQARVAQSERLASIGMLAAGVAHEINNPLGGVLALTALTVEDTPETDPRRANLCEVLRQTERCRDIVKSLLEFSRQAGPGTERLDVNQSVKETLALIGNQSLFFNVDVVLDCAPQLPPILAERSQMQQVFMNLFVNAAQAMREHGQMTVHTSYCAWDGHVEIRISDTGHGIAPDHVARIFDPFFTTKGNGHGTGLGLSIVYGIIAKHGGTITVDSVEGKGTTFIVRFPAV
ncbi:MAG TPA: ATP-binding protein [Longimicrobiales bacterium]|nr:ATP-binding protein [Longimicrobiales bacterium]